ncbi:chemotaxis protein MotB [Lachnospiraceae bacterium XBB2008]|nr:chemotaxis protein MotB [Lachnospiraceae bacterium XBB2008]
MVMDDKMKRRRKTDEETTYWLSYSDMMAGLLLVFVLIIAFTMLHAKMQYDEKQTELIGKEQELLVQADELEKERDIVAQQKTTLDEQAEMLNAQEEALAEQGEKIAIQEETLREQHELLNKLEAIMSEQQQKLDDIIGVRAELVEELSREFDDSDLKVTVDETTGAITFDASILFDYNKSVLKPSGKEFLAEFLPRYVDVLLSPKYRNNISEILIEGHTDTEGSYLTNLGLSQKRALAVAEYCLSEKSGILTDGQLEAMRTLVSASGRSYSNPIYDEDGEIDMAASRRVEFLFRLKDEEMVREMIEILSE